MTATISSTALAWLLTYAIHSTVLLGLAWVLVRVRPWTPSAAELLWKSAMLGGLLTASVQIGFDVRPSGTVSLATPSAAVAPFESTREARRSASAPGADVVPLEAREATSSPAAPLSPAGLSLPKETLAVLAWALVAVILGFSYIARRLILVGRLGDRLPVPDEPLAGMLSELARDAGLRRTPLLTTTSRISSPIALGVREICVPETALTDLDVEQQRSMLAHELAHLARRDPVWLVVASLIERVLWFQPLNRVASRRIATAAEYICDDWAVRRTGSGVPLARCLAKVAEWIQASPLGVPVAGMAEERSLLVSRVARLLEGARPSSSSRRGVAVAMAALLVATIVIAPGVSGRSSNVLLADTTTSTDTAAMSDSDQQPEKDSEDRVAPSTRGDTVVVIALVARLADENADVRTAAAQSLGKLEDPRAVPGLIRTLKDASAQVRASAADALGKFQDARAIAPLTALLDDRSVEVRQNALDALSQYEENAVPSAAIVRLLGDADADIRHNAAHMAGKLRDRSLAGELTKLVRDPKSDVRQAAIEALGEMKDASVSSVIVAALADPDPDVRQQALNSLEELRAPIAEATLLALMRDSDANVRQKAAHIAGERSIVDAIPALRRMLDDANGEVRESAIEALSNIADPAAHDALRDALTSKDAKVRRSAAQALGDRRP